MRPCLATCQKRLPSCFAVVGCESSLPSPYMSQFLTVKEAAKLTGKSPSSIRRVIYPIIHDDAHADRPQISPSVEEAQAHRLKGENFAWRISEELLQREIPAAPPSEKSNTPSPGMSEGHSELLAMLRDELQIKNQQITQQTEMLGKQMELINGLSERLREGNVLIGSLQQRLALTAGSSQMKADDAKAPPTKHGRGESSSKSKNTSTKPAKKTGGLFHRIFG